MIKQAGVLLIGSLFVVACDHASSPSSPSAAGLSTAAAATQQHDTAQGAPGTPGQARVGFGFNGTVSGFNNSKVFVSGGGAYNRVANFVEAGGGFRCLEAVLQGPLSTSLNPNTPGPCLAGEGVRWDTAALLASTTFKCTGAAGEALKTAVTTDATVVLQADFYRASNGNDESFTAKMIVSDSDLAPEIEGIQNLWVQGVGCGSAVAVNFGR